MVRWEEEAETGAKMMSGRKAPGKFCLDEVTGPEASLGKGFLDSLLSHCFKTVSPAEESTAVATQLQEALHFHCLFRTLFIVLA